MDQNLFSHVGVVSGVTAGLDNLAVLVRELIPCVCRYVRVLGFHLIERQNIPVKYGERIGHLFHPRVRVEVINVYRIKVWSKNNFRSFSFKDEPFNVIKEVYLFLSLFLCFFFEEVFANGRSANEYLQEVVDQVVTHANFPEP